MQYDQPKDIYFEDRTVIHVLGEGKLRLPTVNSTYDVVLDLHRVLLVPKLTKDLFSVPTMALMVVLTGINVWYLRMVRYLSLVVYCMANCTLSIPLSMLKFQQLTVGHRLKFGTVY